ncbi:MAG: 50S ribosomal protein L29 [Candidatus Endonucleobacter bathymodioli]|uniref:Large ribosomal subunit protein uL29 n=1 Tax=Candidatus Endonucleibacter bathymodioli TaxID=539814 RepID=A0AA90NKF6_9GAMM|nr:50S ribosomal protein L29 [Candidatus Endonucleobacter bathymodioli]
MKAEQLRDNTAEELNIKLFSLRREQFDLRMRKSTGQLNQNHLLKLVRRDIARIKTVLNQKTGSQHG